MLALVIASRRSRFLALVIALSLFIGMHTSTATVVIDIYRERLLAIMSDAISSDHK
jgi:uncharacterized membrane protein